MSAINMSQVVKLSVSPNKKLRLREHVLRFLQSLVLAKCRLYRTPSGFVLISSFAEDKYVMHEHNCILR